MNNIAQHNPLDLSDPSAKRDSGLIQRWYALTALPDAPEGSAAQREAVRRSRLSSSVIFFLSILVFSLLPVALLVIRIYPTYIWLLLVLLFACLIGLALNRRGHTNAAGIIVTTASFLSLTGAFFSTIPFDETTLQAYDMFIVTLLLSVSLLPPRTVFLFYVLCVSVVIATLLKMPLTPTLQADMQSRMLLIIARPVGTLFMGGGVAYILATQLTRAITRANRVELIAQLEHERAQLRQNLEDGIGQILQTHVQISNGDLSARAPLSDDSVLWKIGQALNTLLVRYQRATQAEQEYYRIEQVVQRLVAQIQEAERRRERPRLPLTHTTIDRLITALQGQSIDAIPPTFAEGRSTTNPPRRKQNLTPPY